MPLSSPDAPTDRHAVTPETPAARPRRSIGTDIALIAAFAALVAVCGLLPALKVNGLVPITLQTFAVLLCGAVLGSRRGFLAVLLYLVVGSAGLPIFSEGRAGLGVFAGPRVGYLVGFPFAAALCGFLVERLPATGRKAGDVALVFLCGLAGSAAFIHTLGIAGLVWRADMTWTAAMKFELTYVPGDLLKNLAMALVATSVHRAFPDLRPRRGRARS